MNHCTELISSYKNVLNDENYSQEERKGYLKNLISNYISRLSINLSPEDYTDIPLMEILSKIDENLKSDRSYCKDLTNALILGMGIVQNQHITLTKKNGKERLSEPLFSYSSNGELSQITILSKADIYRTLLKISKYFDNRFLKTTNKRTLHL